MATPLTALFSIVYFSIDWFLCFSSCSVAMTNQRKVIWLVELNLSIASVLIQYKKHMNNHKDHRLRIRSGYDGFGNKKGTVVGIWWMESIQKLFESGTAWLTLFCIVSVLVLLLFLTTNKQFHRCLSDGTIVITVDVPLLILKKNEMPIFSLKFIRTMSVCGMNLARVWIYLY